MLTKDNRKTSVEEAKRNTPPFPLYSRPLYGDGSGHTGGGGSSSGGGGGGSSTGAGDVSDSRSTDGSSSGDEVAAASAGTGSGENLIRR